MCITEGAAKGEELSELTVINACFQLLHSESAGLCRLYECECPLSKEPKACDNTEKVKRREREGHRETERES